MLVTPFTCAIVFSAFAPFFAVSAVSNTTNPTSLLDSYGLHLHDAVSLANATFTCQILQSLFPFNETFAAKSTYYSPLYEIPWSQTCWFEPACIVTPNTASDLAKIILVLNVFESKFAVRSGGHTVAPGFSSVGGDGILLALQNLDTLAISSDRKTMTIGTGNRWGAVYEYAAQNGVNIVGGREPMVGVGGFLLGGGLSLFYNTFGLGMDQITRYQVVLTNGSVVDATPTQNVDLYKALKGGLTNFGIVTEFDVMTNLFTDIYFEIYTYDAENTPAVIEAYGNYLANPNFDSNSNVEIDVTTTYSLAFLGYNARANKPAIFDEFYRIPIKSTIFPPTNGTVNDIVFGVDGNAVSLGSTYESTFSHKITDPAFMLKSYQIFLDFNKRLLPNMTFYYIPQGLTPSSVFAGQARNGGNMLNLASVSQAWVDTYIDYVDIENSVLAQSVVDAFVANLTQNAATEGLDLSYLYVNNADAAQKPLKAYGGQSLAFFKEVAAKYDPRGVMQRLQGAGYLVSTE